MSRNGDSDVIHITSLRQVPSWQPLEIWIWVFAFVLVCVTKQIFVEYIYYSSSKVDCFVCEHVLEQIISQFILFATYVCLFRLKLVQHNICPVYLFIYMSMFGFPNAMSLIDIWLKRLPFRAAQLE
jgi:hypothetical protein